MATAVAGDRLTAGLIMGMATAMATRVAVGVAMVTAAAGVATAITTTITMMIDRSERKKSRPAERYFGTVGQPRQEVTGKEEVTLSRIQSRSLCPLG